MTRRTRSLALFGILAASLTALSQDSGTKTDWSQYVPVNTIMAEVRKVDGNTVTLRVYWTEAEIVKDNDNDKNKNNKNKNNNNKNNNNKNNKNSKNNNNRPNPLQRLQQQARQQQARMNQQKVEYHQEHHDYRVALFPDTAVMGKVPTSKGEDGKPVPATASDLVPGMVVQAALIREKKIELKDFTEKDLKLRAIAVLGNNPGYKPDPKK